MREIKEAERKKEDMGGNTLLGLSLKLNHLESSLMKELWRESED